MSKKELEDSALGSLGRVGLVLCLIIFIGAADGQDMPDWAPIAAMVSMLFWVAWGSK